MGIKYNKTNWIKKIPVLNKKFKKERKIYNLKFVKFFLLRTKVVRIRNTECMCDFCYNFFVLLAESVRPRGGNSGVFHISGSKLRDLQQPTIDLPHIGTTSSSHTYYNIPVYFNWLTFLASNADVCIFLFEFIHLKIFD